MKVYIGDLLRAWRYAQDMGLGEEAVELLVETFTRLREMKRDARP